MDMTYVVQNYMDMTQWELRLKKNTSNKKMFIKT